MKIVSLIAENVKRITAVHIDPTGNLVEITGKNGQGKTSVLDSIWWALDGAENVQQVPIRQGENSARIVLKLRGDGRELIVTRDFMRKGERDFTTKLTVATADGARFSKGQATLDEIIGELSFDPLAFTRMKAREQFDALRQFVPGVDFDAIDGRNKTDFERRTEVKRLARDQNAAANIIIVPEDTPAEPIDEKALTTELQAAGTLNADIERRKVLRAQADQDVEKHRASAQQIIDGVDGEIAEIDLRFEAQIAALHQQIEAAKQQCDTERVTLRIKRTDEAAAATAAANELRARLDSAEELPAIIDTSEIVRRIEEARATNVNVEKARQKAIFSATAKKYEDEADQLSANIDARTKQKQEAIAAAKMPVPGVGFGDGIVLLDGVPFEQASDAQRLRASVAIAMAANPKLRVIRVRDGSLLDEDSMRILEEMCKARDFQCWIETVAGDGKNAFVIVDGHVQSADAAERAA